MSMAEAVRWPVQPLALVHKRARGLFAKNKDPLGNQARGWTVLSDRSPII